MNNYNLIACSLIFFLVSCLFRSQEIFLSFHTLQKVKPTAFKNNNTHHIEIKTSRGTFYVNKIPSLKGQDITDAKPKFIGNNLYNVVFRFKNSSLVRVRHVFAGSQVFLAIAVNKKIIGIYKAQFSQRSLEVSFNYKKESVDKLLKNLILN